MIDMIASMESSAEMRLDDMTEGLPQGKFLCGCGSVTDFAEFAALAHTSDGQVCAVGCLEGLSTA